MARGLESIVNDIYSGYALRPASPWRYRSNRASVYSPTRYMEIPIGRDQIEVPVLALAKFLKEEYDNTGKPATSLVIDMYDSGVMSSYKSIESIFKELSVIDYSLGKLVKVQIKPEEPIYYFSYGAIFNSSYTPIAMTSWIMKRVQENLNDGTYKYEIIRPLLRIDPICFTEKTDSVQKFIVNRLTTASLSEHISFPNTYRVPESITRMILNRNNRICYRDVKIEIDKFPFTIKEVSTPSINTNNDELLQIAKNYIDEIL